jgi:hypothetical protein
MNTLDHYNNDERSNYSFNFHTEDGKHVNLSFRAEPDYDLDVIFSEFKNFLIASGHDIQGDIGELGIDGGDYEDGDEPSVFATWTEDYENYKKEQVADKFSMDNIPNNNWMFGPNVKGQTWPTDAAAQYFSQQGMNQEQNWHNTWGSSSIPALTSADFASLTVTDLQTLSTQGYSDWANINKHPTMAPITQEQIKSWTTSAPGTLGGAKIDFK